MKQLTVLPKYTVHEQSLCDMKNWFASLTKNGFCCSKSFMNKQTSNSFFYDVILFPSCTGKNNLNLYKCKAKPVLFGSDATLYVWFLGSKAKHIYRCICSSRDRLGFYKNNLKFGMVPLPLACNESCGFFLPKQIPRIFTIF